MEQEWLTITGAVADAITDGQEIVYTSYKGTDGSFKDAEILQVKKWNGETHLIYREPQVILEKLKGKEINLGLRKKKENHKEWKARELNMRQSQAWSRSECRGWKPIVMETLLGNKTYGLKQTLRMY